MPAPNPFEDEGGVEYEISVAASEILRLWPAHEQFVNLVIEDNTLSDWECCEVLQGLHEQVLDYIDEAEEAVSFWPPSDPTCFDKLAMFDYVESTLKTVGIREAALYKARKFVVGVTIELSRTPLASFLGLGHVNS